MPLRRRVNAAFDAEKAEDFGQQYLSMLVTNWHDVAQAMRRAYVGLILLVVAFFLLSGAETAGFNLGPLRLTNVASVLILIPVLVSFLLCELVLLSSAYESYGSTVRELVRAMHPAVYENDLHFMITPAASLPSGYDGPSWADVRARPRGAATKVFDVTSSGVDWVLIVGSFGFFIYAYILLYSDQHASVIAVSLGLVVTVLYVVRAAAIAFEFDADAEVDAGEREENEEDRIAEPNEDGSL